MLNENIKALRKAADLSQEELASKLNVVRQTISKWEKGISVPDAQMLARLAEALDSSVSTLLGESLPENESSDTTQNIARKLEALNEQFARQNENRRKTWRIFFIVIGVLALMGLARWAIGSIYACSANKAMEESLAVIGGADGPTAIFVTSASANVLPVLLVGTAAVISGAGLYLTRRK